MGPSAANRRLAAAIEADEPLATTGIVMLELLAGARDEHQARELERLLGRCEFLASQEPFDHQAAAALYRSCRSGGRTVRRLPDCLIAAVAIRADCELLHRDTDFDAIAAHSALATVPLG